MNPNLEFHKQKLAEILERDKRGELKTYSKEEFETILEARKQRLLEKIAQETGKTRKQICAELNYSYNSFAHAKTRWNKNA